MRIVEMERRTMNGEPVEYGIDENGEDYRDWWCVIETKEEELVYDKFTSGCEPCAERLWNMMVKHAGQGMGVNWGDDDMYGYIRPDEVAPEVGEDFVDGDGDTWVVIN